MGFDLPDDDPTLAAANLAVQLRALLPRVPRACALIALLSLTPAGDGLAGRRQRSIVMPCLSRWPWRWPGVR